MAKQQITFQPVAFEYAKFENVGDAVTGTYVASRIRKNQWDAMVKEYILVDDEGKKIIVPGRMPNQELGYKVIKNMDIVPLGSYIQIKFTGEGSAKAGRQPAKFIEPFTSGVKKEDVLKEFNEQFDFEAIESAGLEEPVEDTDDDLPAF